MSCANQNSSETDETSEGGDREKMLLLMMNEQTTPVPIYHVQSS